jgi:hypothetical protein
MITQRRWSANSLAPRQKHDDMPSKNGFTYAQNRSGSTKYMSVSIYVKMINIKQKRELDTQLNLKA